MSSGSNAQARQNKINGKLFPYVKPEHITNEFT